jgi:hypothetical protein
LLGAVLAFIAFVFPLSQYAFTVVKARFTLARCPLSGALPVAERDLPRAQAFITVVGLNPPLVLDTLALVSLWLPLVRYAVAFIGLDLSFVRCAVSLISGSLPLVGDSLTLVGLRTLQTADLINEIVGLATSGPGALESCPGTFASVFGTLMSSLGPFACRCRTPYCGIPTKQSRL